MYTSTFLLKRQSVMFHCFTVKRFYTILEFSAIKNENIPVLMNMSKELIEKVSQKNDNIDSLK